MPFNKLTCCGGTSGPWCGGMCTPGGGRASCWGGICWDVTWGGGCCNSCGGGIAILGGGTLTTCPTGNHNKIHYHIKIILTFPLPCKCKINDFIIHIGLFLLTFYYFVIISILFHFKNLIVFLNMSIMLHASNNGYCHMLNWIFSEAFFLCEV